MVSLFKELMSGIGGRFILVTGSDEYNME